MMIKLRTDSIEFFRRKNIEVFAVIPLIPF